MSSNAPALTAAQGDHIKAAFDAMKMSLFDIMLAHIDDERDIRNLQAHNRDDEDSDDESPAEYRGSWSLLEIEPDDTYATIEIAFSWEMDPATKEAMENYILERIVTQDVPESLIKFTWSLCGLLHHDT